MKSYDEYINGIDLQVEDIIARSQAYMQGISGDEVRDHISMAYEFAKQAHKKDTRLS